VSLADLHTHRSAAASHGPQSAAKTAARADLGADGVARPIANAMTIDVEDYFQVHAFARRIDRASWDHLQRRVERNTDRILAMLAESGRHATFFTLSWVAERHPALIRRIASAGHEVASHGVAHHLASEQQPTEFRADVRRSRDVLEQVAGVPVRGYRAANFSIGRGNMWAFDVLAEEGYAYSSSIYPIRHDTYGMPEAPRFAFRPRGSASVLEIPISTVALLGRNLPCGGGGYFRLLPYALSRWQIGRVNRHDGQPCVFYLHPWEIDPEQPRPAGLGLRTRFRHYVNLGRTADRLGWLLRDFSWERMDRIFLPAEPQPA
jgi:polysaccharide deacetylase family protein (PEP-CTERM system associated)